MDETHNSQSGMLQVGREDVLVQAHAVARLIQSTVWQKGKIIVVSCGEHNGIYLKQGRGKLLIS